MCLHMPFRAVLRALGQSRNQRTAFQLGHVPGSDASAWELARTREKPL
jgi:hypothetical protein